MAVNLRRSLRGAPVNAPKPRKPRTSARRSSKRDALVVVTRHLGDRTYKILTVNGRAIRGLLPNTMDIRYRYGMLRTLFFEADEHNHIANLRALRLVTEDIMKSTEDEHTGELRHLVREIKGSIREIAAAQNEGKRGERVYLPEGFDALCDIPVDMYSVPDEVEAGPDWGWAEEARTTPPEEETPSRRVEDFVPGAWREYPDNLVRFAADALRLHLEGGSNENPRIMALFYALHGGSDAITIPEHQRMAVQFHSLLAAIRARR